MTSEAQALRAHLARVAILRTESSASVRQALISVRRAQVARFGGTYTDLLNDPRHAPAAHFFLSELYGDRDYTERDAQFSRIAGTLERLFPAKVMAVALRLAEVHALTEELDWAMATHWATTKLANSTEPNPAVDAEASSAPTPVRVAAHYAACWQLTARPSDRQRQLDDVLSLGRELADLVRTPGLRTALKLMRRPAQAAGLGELQRVLEQGFDAFKAMGTASHFLSAIHARESLWLTRLFAKNQAAARSELARCLSLPRAPAHPINADH